MVICTERCLPQLHGVHTRGLGSPSLKNQHLAIGVQGIAVGHNGGAQGFVDQVVGEERIVPVARLVEHIQHVFAIGRTHGALEAQVVHDAGGQVEMFELT